MQLRTFRNPDSLDILTTPTDFFPLVMQKGAK